jgi:hypothetical protein
VAAATASPVAPATFLLATTAEVLAGAAALVGRSILYRWPPLQDWVPGPGPGKGGPG